MARVRVLPETVANQIAAGEVVERPASVVKELVENALDAGARRIAVAIARGGRDRIRIEDDGSGILAEDVPVALARHATSKLTAIDDLKAIGTLGFRGEALPSIASVSRLTLTTRAAGEAAGTRALVAGGRIEAIEKAASPAGTTVEVSDLFFNVPARLKFLKSVAAETAAATAVVIRQALAHPEVHFSLERDGKLLLSYPRAGSRRERIGQVLGHERAEGLIEATRAEGGIELEALIERPSRHAATRAEQYLFVGHRPVVDRGLQHALTLAYQGLLPAGRFPAGFVFLRLAAGQVDVNVHPAKSEVRFADAQAVQALVRRAAREALARSGFAPELQVPLHAEGVREAVETYLGRAAAAPAAPARLYRMARVESASAAAPEPPRALGDRPRPAPVAPPPPPVPVPAAALREVRVIGQLRATFILAEDEQGLVLLDQHTAHERVLFEKLRRLPEGQAEAQRLLLPEVVELPPRLAALVEPAAAELARFGVEVEPLGGRSIAVRSLPLAIPPAGAGKLVLELLTALLDEGEAPAAGRRDRALATVACHAAVKVRMPLDAARMEWLVKELLACADPFVCPHGRAVILRLDHDAIKKSFGRYW